jgi:hypothetical protein
MPNRRERILARTTLLLAASIIRRAIRIVPVMRIGYSPPANAG